MKALPKRKGNRAGRVLIRRRAVASMKALPKRKGNEHDLEVQVNAGGASMKALPKRKGNPAHRRAPGPGHRLNESPSQKEGKYQREDGGFVLGKLGLNESPSQKEGKLWHASARRPRPRASMKALPKRKGNPEHHSPVREH